MNKKETIEQLTSLAIKLDGLESQKEYAETYVREATQRLEEAKQDIGSLVLDHNQAVYDHTASQVENGQMTPDEAEDFQAHECLPLEFIAGYHLINIECADGLDVQIRKEPESLHFLKNEIEYREEKQAKE